MTEKQRRELAGEIFTKALLKIDPQKVVAGSVSINGNELEISGQNYDLNTLENIYVIALGKAAQSMALGLDSVLAEHITAGVLLSNTFSGDMPDKYSCHICTHPLPVEQNIVGADKALELAEKATENDLVICLISGGGSSIFSRPAEGLTIKDLARTADVLMKAGAPISDLNAARKHLSMVKGGKLLRIIQPAPTVALCLSDVPGDDKTVIASGPTAHDNSTYQDVLSVFEKYQVVEKLPDTVISFIKDGVAGNQVETLKAGHSIFSNACTRVIGRNGDMLAAMAELSKTEGFEVEVVSEHFEGEARFFGKMIAEKAKNLRSRAVELGKPLAWMQGGETTVCVKGQGIGGRNSEVALSAALELSGLKDCLVLAAGTDGKDGPTDAAGAIADGTSLNRAQAENIDPGEILMQNDSFNFFEPIGDTIVTGPTGTNLMDVVMILAWN